MSPANKSRAAFSRLRLPCYAALGALLVALCVPTAPSFSAAPASGIQFEDVTRAAGIHFTQNNGAFGKVYLPEAMGSGVAFIDYDNDGWQDLFFVNGSDWPGHRRTASHPALYHNNRDGTFTDVTSKAGLAINIYGMGVAIGDYNNDGFDDIFITALGQNRLFRNNGNGTFTDVTKQAGLAGPNEFSTSAAWVDYDRDGQSRSGGGELCAVVAAIGHLLHLGWKNEIVLHAGIVSRELRCGCGTIAATERSRTRRKRPGFSTRLRKVWASQS